MRIKKIINALFVLLVLFGIILSITVNILGTISIQEKKDILILIAIMLIIAFIFQVIRYSIKQPLFSQNYRKNIQELKESIIIKLKELNCIVIKTDDINNTITIKGFFKVIDWPMYKCWGDILIIKFSDIDGTILELTVCGIPNFSILWLLRQILLKRKAIDVKNILSSMFYTPYKETGKDKK